MTYVFPDTGEGGYSGPFHDYYLYGDFDGDLPTNDSGGGVKALITGVNPSSAIGQFNPDLSGVLLKPRSFNNHASLENAGNQYEERGGTANFSSYLSWNAGYKSCMLISPRHIISTRHDKTNRWNKDRGYGVGVMQFMEKDGTTFNVNTIDAGGYLGSGLDSVDGDYIVHKLSEEITGRDVTINNVLWDSSKTPGDRSSQVVLNSNGVMRFFTEGGAERNDEMTGPLTSPQPLFGCDSGSITFFLHKTEGTLMNSGFQSGFRIHNDLTTLNNYLVSEGYSGITLLSNADLDTSNGGFYNYRDFNIPALSNSSTYTPQFFNNGKKLKVTITGTRADGKKTKPFTKEIQITATGSVPPNFTNLNDPVESNNPFSNSLYCSPGTDGAEISYIYGSYYLGFTTDVHPADELVYSRYGVTCDAYVDVAYGSTLSGEFNSIADFALTKDSISGGGLVAYGGTNFEGIRGIAGPISFPNEVAGQTVYIRPNIFNTLGSTQGDWYELGRAITAGRGSTFTSFSFDNYSPTAGGTMIGTAAGYTAIPEIGTNKIQNLFGLGGLTVADIRINGASYVSGITFSGPTFALKIPSDCPEGASLGILNIASIKYTNPYIIDGVGVTFPGELSGVTYINVGGS